MMRLILFALGAVSLALSIIGIFLPVLPTVPFVLLTAACWAKASPRLHAALLRNPHFGKIIRNWENHRAIPRYAKILSGSMMAASVGITYWRLPQYPWLAAAFALIAIAVSVWIWRHPDR